MPQLRHAHDAERLMLPLYELRLHEWLLIANLSSSWAKVGLGWEVRMGQGKVSAVLPAPALFKLSNKLLEGYPDRIAEVNKVEQINASISTFVFTVMALSDSQTGGDVGLEQLRLLPQSADQIEQNSAVALSAGRASRFSGHRVGGYVSIERDSKMDYYVLDYDAVGWHSPMHSAVFRRGGAGERALFMS